MVYFAGQIRDCIGSSVIKNLISEFEEITRGYTHHLVGIAQGQMRHLRPGSSCQKEQNISCLCLNARAQFARTWSTNTIF